MRQQFRVSVFPGSMQEGYILPQRSREFERAGSSGYVKTFVM